MVVARGTLISSALETALKIKEICYIHAEGMSASEFKHGPLALIDERTPTLAFVDKESENKTVSNIQEIKARGGLVYGVVDEKCSKETKSVFDYYVEIPCSDFTFLNPILFTICGQLINYHIATILGVNVDRPRNLAKSVTTE
jgi:glucosamine--fructose-6-phosphate aminotransferase (isomerizing)